MKRKTNLFYTSGEDSKFLTFSNYTEALTGNFLSTNIKVLPNKFLCLNIPNLNIENKLSFIQETLVAKYENKLAVLRDGGFEDIDELGILLDYIYDFVNDETAKIITNISDITEQDFNGTFTDIICVLDTAKLNIPEVNITKGNVFYADPESNKLHGWYNDDEYVGPASYEHIKPIYDENELTGYYTNTSATINEVIKTTGSITFNVIIPLFNIYNTVSFTELKQNCPLGIWFADKPIELSYDGKYGQSWSLAIGSQFKPLPTMDRNISDVTNDSNKIAYATFAQILSRQNNVLATFEKLSEQIATMQNQINILQSKLNTTDVYRNLEDKINILNTTIGAPATETTDATGIFKYIDSKINNLNK